MMGKRQYIEWEILPKLTFEEPNKLLAALYSDGEDFLCEIYNDDPNHDLPEGTLAYPKDQFTVRLFKDKLSRVVALLRLPEVQSEGDCAFAGILFGRNEEEAPIYCAILSAPGGIFSLCSFDKNLTKKDLALAPLVPEKQIEALVSALQPAF